MLGEKGGRVVFSFGSRGEKGVKGSFTLNGEGDVGYARGKDLSLSEKRNGRRVFEKSRKVWGKRDL